MISQQPAIDPAGELERAARLLWKNPTLAVPTAIASLATALLIFLFIASLVGSIAGLAVFHGAGIPLAGFGLMTGLGSIVVIFVLSIVAHAIVVRAAADAWLERPIDLGASVNAAVGALGHLIAAAIVIGLIMIVPIALSVIVIGLPLLLVAAFFLMYVMPAIMIGNRGGIEAIGVSARIALDNVGPTVVAAVGIVVAIAIGQIVMFAFGHVPVIGWLAALVVGGFGQAYAALVATRFYALLAR